MNYKFTPFMFAFSEEGRVIAWKSLHYSTLSNKMSSNKSEIIVMKAGLYLVTAQLYYMHSHRTSGFEVIAEDGMGNRRLLTRCSSGGIQVQRNERVEDSCFTATVAILHRSDKLYIQQRELDRVISLQGPGTHLGLIRLSDA